jgi:hypothetical protein
VFTAWNGQNVTPAPSLPVFLLGFCLPLLVALPAIARAVRRMEEDGDGFMLLWLAAMLVLVFLPTNIQRRFAVGMMLPIAYFAVRAYAMVWSRMLTRRLRPLVASSIVVVSAISSVWVLLVPVLALNAPEPAFSVRLNADYQYAFDYIDRHSTAHDVVLSAPGVSVWVPGWTGARVVYGHPYETINAEQREAEVLAWYVADAEAQRVWLAANPVQFVLLGTEERAIGGVGDVRTDALRVVATFADVSVYAPAR